MASYNKVLIMGNLTRDPEVKYTQKGTAISELSIAVSKKWKDDAGKMQEKTCFVSATAFGRTAEVIGEHFKKGKPIFIEGELTQDQWEDKDTGKKREKTKVAIQSFQFVGGSDEKQSGNGGQSSPRPAAKPAPKEFTSSNDDGDIPF